MDVSEWGYKDATFLEDMSVDERIVNVHKKLSEV